MEIIIPGSGTLDIRNIMLDYNGTLAVDGIMIPGVGQILNELSILFNIHVVTADTFGTSGSELRNVKCTLSRLDAGDQSGAKLRYLTGLGKDNTACIGNGKNDMLMLKESVLGIAVIQEEGAYTPALIASDIVCPDIFSALGYFRKPERLVATLRD